MPSINTKCIRFDQFGEPKKVLYLDQFELDLSQLDAHNVLVRWLASPIDPIDFLIIRGIFKGYKPKLPAAVAGTEGVGVVEKIGLSIDQAQQFNVGDHVIRFNMPSTECPAGGGIWTQFSIVPAKSLLKIDPKIGLVSSATLGINPPTAYALIKEMIPLEKGDHLVQNGANSGVGRAIIQLAKHFGFQTINLIRKHEHSEEISDELKELGADWVFTQDELSQAIDTPHKLPKAKLGLLNCVGGDSASLVSKLLSENGTLITYGEISEESSKVEENISQKFFSINKFTGDKQNADKIKAIFAELQGLIREGKLRPSPAEFSRLDQFGEAVDKAISHGIKQILLIDESNQNIASEN